MCSRILPEQRWETVRNPPKNPLTESRLSLVFDQDKCKSIIITYLFLYIHSFQTAHLLQNSSSASEVLEKLNSAILNHENQIIFHDKNEETKVEFLRDAIRGCSCHTEFLNIL